MFVCVCVCAGHVFVCVFMFCDVTIPDIILLLLVFAALLNIVR